MADEQFIEIVKKYPILYNVRLVEYKDLHRRHDAWKEISEKIKLPIEVCKMKWNKLRNSFTNALKRHRTKCRQSLTPYAFTWKYNKQLRFLTPHILGGEPISCIALNDKSIYTRLCNSKESSTVNNTLKPSTSNGNINNENKNLEDILPKMNTNITDKEKEIYNNLEIDEMDYFFLSMSKIVKKFEKTIQSNIRYKIYDYIDEVTINISEGELNDTDYASFIFS